MELEDNTAFEADDKIDVQSVDPPRDLIRKPDLETMGRAAFFLAMSLCLLVLGLPLLLIFLVKSPESLQTMAVLGLSYQKLLFTFLLSAAITAYVCMFFLRIRPLGILMFFALSIFSCFPLIVGLKNNLSLQQAIVAIPFFQSWPFFLRPGYILIEFLLPAAIISCLILQIKSILSRKPYRFTFSLVALYLAIAAFFGFSALTQAGQPNLVSALVWMKESRTRQQPPRRAEIQPPQAENAGGAPISIKNPLEVGIGRPEAASGSETGMELDRKVQILSDKVDRILEVLTQTEPRSDMQQATPPMADAEARKARSSKVQPTAGTVGEVLTNKPVIEDLSSKMQTVSEKVERILETLTRMQTALPLLQENSPVDEGTTELERAPEPRTSIQSADQTSLQPTGESTTSRPALEDLNQKAQALSEKMDHVMETLDKMESLLPGQKEIPGKEIQPPKPQ